MGPYRSGTGRPALPHRTVRGRLRSLWRRFLVATPPKRRCAICCNLLPRRQLTRQRIYSSVSFSPAWVYACADRHECLHSKARNHADHY
jgi:hypothetical protein